MMKKFLYKIFFFICPMFFLLVLYLVCDPFAVFKFKEMRSINPTYNRACQGVLLFNKNNKIRKYNSFIIGSSRSRMYNTYEWEKHLNVSSSCFHFDQARQDLFGMEKQLSWLDQKVTGSIDNLLLIMDVELLSDITAHTGIPFINPPQIMHYDNFLSFHSALIQGFYNPKFFIPYFDLKINNEWKEYMKHGGFEPILKVDTMTNDNYFTFVDSLIDKGGYYEKINFYERDSLCVVSPPIIKEGQKRILIKIKKIIDKNKTKTKIVISPLYNQIKINPVDLLYLNSLFGPNVVYDFSGVNRFTEDYHNYYETSHYRKHVCDEIMNIIYDQTTP